MPTGLHWQTRPPRIPRPSHAIPPLLRTSVLVLLLMLSSAELATAADTTPPDPPTGLYVEQGESWRSDSSYRVWWVNPGGQDAPITSAHYELCAVMPSGPCTAYEVPGVDIDEFWVVVPSRGWFQVRVWLEDAEGNVDPTLKSPHIYLRFDDASPGRARIDLDGAWRKLGASGSLLTTVDIPIGGFVPLSEIRGYSVTLDGTDPDSDVEITAVQDYARYPADLVLEDLPEGVTTVKARAVSNAGVASDEVGAAALRVDRTPPVVVATGVPQVGKWSRGPVVVEVAGTDQEHLSGMAGSPESEPVEDGGHIEYRVDGGGVERVRGDRASVSLEKDGRHEIAFRAVDLAGNASVEKEVAVDIDGTPPTGFFEAPDPRDPRRITAVVQDVTSGVDTGWIEVRRPGASSFTRLPTRLEGGRLVAVVDDEQMPQGPHEFRARIVDRAGNAAIVDRQVGGGAMVRGLPLRSPTTVSVSMRPVAKRVCVAPKRAKARPKRAGKRKARVQRKRCIVKQGAPPAKGKALRLAYGERAVVTGRVLSASGLPLAGAKVLVEAQARSGGPTTRLAELTADARGELRYTVPAGPSRIVWLRYAGTSIALPGAGLAQTAVPAAVRLKPSRRRLRNGQAVVFRGRLLGRPIPRGGKVVALQAKVGRSWRTFATPRANARGAFTYRYRFTATTGLRRYVFRAVAAREDAYPYETGTSRPVRVIVRGRS